MIRVTFWKKVQEFISFRPCEKSHCDELSSDTIVPLGWWTCSGEAHPELSCTWHSTGVCWRKLNWEAATGQTDTWYCCLAHPAGLLFQRGLCRAIMHLITLEERKVCFYTDIITVPRWTHKCQRRNLSWEDDMSCTSSTVVHLKSRNVSRKLWSFMLRQHHFIAVTKWHSTETDLIFCFETWSLKLRFCLKSKSDLKKNILITIFNL